MRHLMQLMKKTILPVINGIRHSAGRKEIAGSVVRTPLAACTCGKVFRLKPLEK